jgi:hypothetical protein
MAELQLNDPEALYRRWEGSQWSPYAIDLTNDQAQWPALGGERRDLIYYVLASLMVAEGRITTKFTGLVAAGSSEEEVTFLATQQVDEARHMQFYAATRTRSSPRPPTSPPTSSAPANRSQTPFAKSSTSPSSRRTINFSPIRPISRPRSGSSRSTTRSSKARLG